MRDVQDTPSLVRTCTVCGAAAGKERWRPPASPGPVVVCSVCGFVYVNPIHDVNALILDGPVLGDYPATLLESKDIALLAGSWEAPLIANHLRREAAKRMNARAALAQIAALAPDRGRLLDVGCFCGLFLDEARQAGWACTGIEPLVMPAIYARGQFGLRVVTDTLHQASFPAAYFDVVTAFQVFEHLVYPMEEIEKIRGMLKPGGLLLIEVPNIDTVLVRLLGARHRHFVSDHVSFFSAATLSRLLNQAGFRVRKVYHPTRTLRVGAVLWWLNRYSKGLASAARRILPQRIKETPVRLNLGDMVAVIAEKR